MMGNSMRRQVIRALDLTYDKVCRELFKQMNEYPFKRRFALAWMLVFKKLELPPK